MMVTVGGCKRLHVDYDGHGRVQGEGVGRSAIRWTARLLDLRACAAKSG